ncbi:MAG TPA: TetR/AcrR family transcriptional regulator [Steroidobacteraceae bacterium]|nr:TetR/AcrR family transcriptional regulator [Steroidobacteraceae bacterium]
MSAHVLTPADRDEAAAKPIELTRPVREPEIIDAAARVITRRSDHRILWSTIAHEAGHCAAPIETCFDGLLTLIDACYSRTAQGLSHSLLQAETAPGTALDQVAAFLVSALEIRRSRGVFLSFRRCADLPGSLQRRLHEYDAMTRTRLKRLLQRGHRDGSLAHRQPDAAVELILACLQVPTVVTDGPEQRMWDGELVELLLAGLSEPHPPEDGTRLLG